MFEVKHIKDKSSNFIEVSDSNNKAYAKIDMTLGGSLQELTLDRKTIISSEHALPYEVSYASSILFPFANRIENGVYVFNGKNYQLEINQVEENNALHGLVYNKTFDVVHFASYKNEAVVHLRYIEKGEPMGFPFKYALTLSYIIKSNSVELIVEVKNTDDFSFPFTIGWHPYFVSRDLSNSYLNIDCNMKILVNNQQIPTHEESIAFPNELQIKDIQFDDCFKLNKNQVGFKTPDYKMDFSFSAKENYMQLYIPPSRKSIAIEPQSGAANNFNDNRGLKILHPQELFETRWKINVNGN